MADRAPEIEAGIFDQEEIHHNCMVQIWRNSETGAVSVGWRPEPPKEEKSSGMYECFHCGARAVIWGCDYDAEDLGYASPGIVQQLHCDNCGAEIEYFIPIEEEE